MINRKIMARSFLYLAVIISTSSCALQHKKSYSESLPPNCAYKSFGCNIDQALLASKEVLKTNPEHLSVECEFLVEKKVDDVYKRKCKKAIEALATSLSSKWSNDLVPISVSSIHYRWDLWECIDGIGFGFCRNYGIADIPLQWLAEPPNDAIKGTSE